MEFHATSTCETAASTTDCVYNVTDISAFLLGIMLVLSAMLAMYMANSIVAITIR